MAKWDECLDSIGKTGKIAWRPGEREEMLDNVLAAKRSIMATRKVTDNEAFAQAAAEVATNKKIAAAIAHDQAIRNKLAQDLRMRDVDHGAENLKWSNRDFEGTVSWDARTGSAKSMQSLARSVEADIATTVKQKIVALGAWRDYRKGILDRDLSDRRFRLSNGEPLGTDIRDNIARILHEADLELRERLNSVGAHIAAGTDRPGATVWDRHALQRGGHGGEALIDKDAARSAFAADFDKWLNWDRVMEHARSSSNEESKLQMDEAPEQWKQRLLDSSWNAMVSTFRKASPGEEGFGGAYEGGLNVAKAVSEDRLFYFKDGNSWFEAMQKYGAARTLHENLLLSVRRGARDYALMKVWGPSAEANARRVAADLLTKYRDSDPVQAKDFQQRMDRRGGFTEQFGRFSGAYSGVVGENVAAASHNIRMFYDTTLLGAVGLTHLMSLPATLGSALRSIGANRLEGFSSLFSALMQGRSAAEASETLSQLHVYFESIARPVITEWSQMDWPGRIAYLHSRFLDATGVHYFLDNAKRAMREVAAHYLDQEVMAKPGVRISN